ncbi:hypothetical protein [Gellertiella hungarica]|uniref:Uncharacterized protein n=1 Tax=Gellertiella hungarica TaxID=1572859 RepID=A0A7W6J5A6_9HYPH|nr:hypothetical protein [Gellertiella hungarica]MBB4065044.1 hypothetical protein [Gellertiella hungarica]
MHIRVLFLHMMAPEWTTLLWTKSFGSCPIPDDQLIPRRGGSHASSREPRHSTSGRISAQRPLGLGSLPKGRKIRSETLSAIKDFVVRWEEADWLEAYSIERIGKWIAKRQLSETSEELTRWCKSGSSDARMALLSGLQQGLGERQAALA